MLYGNSVWLYNLGKNLLYMAGFFRCPGLHGEKEPQMFPVE